MRLPVIHHCTSEPLHFFGRDAELAVLDSSLTDEAVAVVALVGPGGQGKTAIVQHWLAPRHADSQGLDGLFLWSFYRGKDAELCLRELYAYAEGLDRPPDVAASYCVDQLLPVLRRERWVIVLDGVEVVQHETGPWFGRLMHPELARLVEELASAPMPGVLVLTTRFPVPTLQTRRHARLIDLSVLDAASARGLLNSLGIQATAGDLDAAATAVGRHAKAVELLGTWLTLCAGGKAERHVELPTVDLPGASAEEQSAARVLAAFQRSLPQETCDLVALATAFRQPPTEKRLLEYLASDPVRVLVHGSWQRGYAPFQSRKPGWLGGQVEWLVGLRLLERVGGPGPKVIDAHPLVRRGFEQYLGPESQRRGAAARAGFLRGRPDRRPPASLEETGEEVELFHAYCDAGLWHEADNVLVALDNPKHRFVAPAFERDLLLRFFPGGDWRQPPLWAGFGRWRSLAICLEMLGQFADALEEYRPVDAALRGDALIALGRLAPLVDQESVPAPWQNLWRAYRAHALALAGRHAEAVAVARSLVAVDVYEWVHLFECLLRTGTLTAADVRAMEAALASGTGWTALVRRRMLADWRRLSEPAAELGAEYVALTEAFDRAGLPWDRALVRLGHARWLRQCGRHEEAQDVTAVVLNLAARQFDMALVAADARAKDGGRP
jgi:hypothetical protein